MPAAIDNAIRSEIVQRHTQGETLRSISQELQLSYYTVRKLWQHWQKTGRLEPSYERAKQPGTRAFGDVYAEAIALKTVHGRWGAQLILLELRQRLKCAQYPSVRTLQRWFRQAGINRTAAVKQSREPFVKRGQAVHQVWAVDAKEQMRLADGAWASWLVVSDEASGAILHTTVFPPQVLDAGRGESGTSQS